MKGDYLWDGRGTPDPEVKRLEDLLARYRYREPAPEKRVIPIRAWSWSMPRVLAAAAVVMLVFAGAWIAMRGSRSYWEVTRVDGTPQVGAGRIDKAARLGVGQWLETDDGSRASVQVGEIGRVEVEPNTRLRLVRSGITEHRATMARGAIHAMIWAPPRLFYVETPSAVAVDLGCTYTLEVDTAGAGLLRVTTGWVGFEHRGRESFTPAGAACVTRPGLGPGTPYYEDAPEALREALRRFDFDRENSEARAEALRVALDAARNRDAFTLWHLLERVEEAQRGAVFDRLASMVAPPENVTREGVLRGDKRMLYRWWNQLGISHVSLWRWWKLPWRE